MGKCEMVLHQLKESSSDLPSTLRWYGKRGTTLRLFSDWQPGRVGRELP